MLVQAKAGALGDETERGVLLGTAETMISPAQVVSPNVADRLYAIEACWPFLASLILIPVSILLAWRKFSSLWVVFACRHWGIHAG